MKVLLSVLRTRIHTELTYLGGEKAVHLLPDEDLLPESTPFPCVGLKDGDVENHYASSSNEVTLTVDIIAYVRINSPEAVIIGKGTQEGILDVVDDLKDALTGYDPTGYACYPEIPSEARSQTVATQDNLVQKKKITMRWLKT